MEEIPDKTCHLMITSPPYFNAPFDYDGFFKNYDSFLGMLEKFASETYRVLQDGRIAVINIDDMLVDITLSPLASTLLFSKKSCTAFSDLGLCSIVRILLIS